MSATTYDPAGYTSQMEVMLHKNQNGGYLGIDSTGSASVSGTFSAGTVRSGDGVNPGVDLICTGDGVHCTGFATDNSLAHDLYLKLPLSTLPSGNGLKFASPVSDSDLGRPGVTAEVSQGSWASFEETENKGIANGYASLDSNGKVPASQLPGDGGGPGAPALGSGGYVDPFPWVNSTPSMWTAPPATNAVYVWKFKVEAGVEINWASFPVASGANPNTIMLGVYDRTCSTLLGASAPKLHGAVADYVIFSTPLFLSSGVYYMAFTADGDTTRGWGPIYDAGYGYLQAAYGQNASNEFAIASNPSSGSGSSLALPASCCAPTSTDSNHVWL